MFYFHDTNNKGQNSGWVYSHMNKTDCCSDTNPQVFPLPFCNAHESAQA